MIRLILSAFLLAAPAAAAPFYDLDAGDSRIGFAAAPEGFSIQGTMPVTRGTARLDLGDVNASEIDVTVSASAIRTGILLATSAIKGPELLDVANHPEVRFVAQRIQRSGNAARVTGALTIKGITHPVTLDATFVRTAEADPDDLARIGIQLRGTMDRHAFGVSGFRDLVGPEIGIDILAWFDRVDG